MTRERELHAVANPIFVRALGVQTSADSAKVSIGASDIDAPAQFGFSDFSIDHSKSATQSN